jgi:hypothetical protein
MIYACQTAPLGKESFELVLFNEHDSFSGISHYLSGPSLREAR